MLSKIINLANWKEKKVPIALRLTLLYAVIFSLTIIVISIAFFKGLQYLGYKKAEESLRETNQEIRDYIKTGRPLDKRIYKEISFSGPIYFKVYNRAGQLLHKTKPYMPIIDFKSSLGEIGSIELSRPERKPDRKEENSFFFYELGEKKPEKVLYLNRKVKHNKKILYVQTGFFLKSRMDIFQLVWILLVGINIVAILLSVVVGNYIAKKMLKPIKDINQTAQEITINNLNERIDTAGPRDELQELAVTFNEMIDRLQESIEKQKQFVADASHELRTPISVIQGYIDLLDRWGKEDKEVLAESIEAIKVETINMKQLLEQLLFLARGDREEYKFETERVNLANLVDEVYQETKLIDEEHEIKLIANESIEIEADPKSIKQLLRIIIDNSLKYTESSGEITISSQVRDEQVEIEITDTGQGIAPEDLDKVFDRFYCVDESRNRESGGAGLGLSIANWIVEEYGGEININSELGAGTEVTIKLPLE